MTTSSFNVPIVQMVMRVERKPWIYIFIGREAEQLWGTKYALERVSERISEFDIPDGMDFNALCKEMHTRGFRFYAKERKTL